MYACRARTRKVEIQYKCIEKDREVRRSVRRDKRKWTGDLSYQPEEAANKGKLKELFAITSVPSKELIQRNGSILNKDGTLRTNTEEHLKHWQEHFSKTLNRRWMIK